MGSLPLVHLLFRAGLSQKTLDYAFKAVIQTGTDHRVEKELVALGADFPADPDFLVTFTGMLPASSHRALEVTEILLCTHHPPKHPAALSVMKMAAKTTPTGGNLQETLLILLANVILAPLEVYEVLLAHLRPENDGVQGRPWSFCGLDGSQNSRPPRTSNGADSYGFATCWYRLGRLRQGSPRSFTTSGDREKRRAALRSKRHPRDGDRICPRDCPQP
jgi:hypothetical protein